MFTAFISYLLLSLAMRTHFPSYVQLCASSYRLRRLYRLIVYAYKCPNDFFLHCLAMRMPFPEEGHTEEGHMYYEGRSICIPHTRAYFLLDCDSRIVESRVFSCVLTGSCFSARTGVCIFSRGHIHAHVRAHCFSGDVKSQKIRRRKFGHDKTYEGKDCDGV